MPEENTGYIEIIEIEDSEGYQIEEGISNVKIDNGFLYFTDRKNRPIKILTLGKIIRFNQGIT